MYLTPCVLCTCHYCTHPCRDHLTILGCATAGELVPCYSPLSSLLSCVECMSCRVCIRTTATDQTVQVAVCATYHHTTTRVQVEYLHHTHHHACASEVPAPDTPPRVCKWSTCTPPRVCKWSTIGYRALWDELLVHGCTILRARAY